MTRNLYIFSGKLEVPKVYEYEFQQSLYATEYRNGRAIVDLGEDVSMSRLQMLREECIRGYLDGIRDELLFQQAEEMKKALE